MAIYKPGTPFKLVYEFYGGINDSAENVSLTGDDQVGATELSDGTSNYVLHLPGSNAMAGRPGLTQASTGVYDEAGIFVFQGLWDGYVMTATKIWDDEASALDSSLTSTTTWDAVSFNGKDIFVNGSAGDQRETNDGTTFAAVGGSPPDFKYLEVYSNYLFGAGHNDGTLRWSALQNEDSWPTENAVTIVSTENDAITGLARFRDALMVFTRNRFFHVTGSGLESLGVAHTAHEGPGCTAHHSIVVTDQGIGWWTQKGFAFSRDGFTVDLPMMRKGRLSFTALDQDKLDDVFGVWDPLHERIIWWVATSALGNRCVVYYYNRDIWFKFGAVAESGIANATAAGLLTTSTDQWSGFQQPHCVGNINSELALFTISQTATSDNGLAFTRTLESTRASVADSTAEARCRDITVEYMTPTNSTITLTTWLDDATSSTDSWVMAASATTTSRKVSYRKKFREMKVGLSGTGDFYPRRIVVRGYILND